MRRKRKLYTNDEIDQVTFRVKGVDPAVGNAFKTTVRQFNEMGRKVDAGVVVSDLLEQWVNEKWKETLRPDQGKEYMGSYRQAAIREKVEHMKNQDSSPEGCD